MFRVQNISDDVRQRQTLVLPNGDLVTLSIRFVSLQQGWFITSLVYKDFTLKGVRISNSPDILYQFRNQLPFGLACLSPSEREPSLQQDFATDASQLFILTSDEVALYTGFLSGEV